MLENSIRVRVMNVLMINNLDYGRMHYKLIISKYDSIIGVGR